MKRLKPFLWPMALALLAAALVFFNLPGQELPLDAPPALSADVPEGCEVGQRLPDFSVTCLDGSTFDLSGQRGRVTVINLWATWCAPCVAELPYFDELQRTHPGVTVLALHPAPVVDDVEAYVRRGGWALLFALDEDNLADRILGGGSLLPRTLVVDGEGLVVYSQTGSITLEILTALVSAAGA
ncbi:MAG: TlpA family protein disulfide reductase [Clostridia bacterium]|nr:TlpA family protein disulfide reductase [Clostridia bacterium]